MADTIDVLVEMDRAFERRQREELETHRKLKQMARRLCDSGLVDDVTPTTNPPPVDDLHLTCGACGAVIPPPEVMCRSRGCR